VDICVSRYGSDNLFIFCFFVFFDMFFDLNYLIFKIIT
jgi:hypothetical protein